MLPTQEKVPQPELPRLGFEGLDNGRVGRPACRGVGRDLVVEGGFRGEAVLFDERDLFRDIPS